MIDPFSEDYWQDVYDARRERSQSWQRNALACRCPEMRGGQVAGHCPGPENCPLQDEDDDDAPRAK